MSESPKSLRELLELLQQEKQLLSFNREHALEPDLSAAAQAGQNIGETSPALMFNNLQGYPDKRIVLNTVSSWPNYALSMGLPKESSQQQIYQEVLRRWSDSPWELQEKTEQPPFMDNIIEGDDINLFELIPLFRGNERDGAPYITKGAFISRDISEPDNDDKENVSIYRVQAKGKNLLSAQFVPGHDCARHLSIAEERGENLKVAIAIGVPPALSVAACSPLPYEESEFKLAAALQDSPFEVYKSEHTGLNLPWSAEYIIEGEIIAGEREHEGPFGEFTGFYCGNRKMPLFKVTRVMHRDQPVFENLHLARPMSESDYIMAFNNGVAMHQELKTNFPGIKAVNALNCYGLVTIISIDQNMGGIAKSAALRAMTTAPGLISAKTVIMVDDDVDPFDMYQVMWAMSCNMNPQFDVSLINGLPSVGLDPASVPTGITAKMVIDACRPTAPDLRGNSKPKEDIAHPTGTGEWEQKLTAMIKAL
ncbi:UbiD family decarboxylase [Endozoicomonadaceae bacterium StTr2]